MDVSIIIPCYLLPDKDCELLRFTVDCLASIRRFCQRRYELVLVDNGSPVGGEFLRQEADVYVRNRANLGYAPAVNQGLRLTRGEWLVVSNNDVTFLDDWPAVAIAAWADGVGAVSSHLHDHDPRHWAGIEVAPWGHMFGALWMTRREVLDVVGYLSEEYELGYYEDKDFWRCLIAAGYSLRKAGWCSHIGNATSGKLPDLSGMFFRNKARFEAKWAPP